MAARALFSQLLSGFSIVICKVALVHEDLSEIEKDYAARFVKRFGYPRQSRGSTPFLHAE